MSLILARFLPLCSEMLGYSQTLGKKQGDKFHWTSQYMKEFHNSVVADFQCEFVFSFPKLVSFKILKEVH